MVKKRGRPETLDKTKEEIVIALLSVGCSLKSAAQYLNIHPRSIRRHAQREHEFAKRIAQAEASLEWGHLQKIKQASGKSWRASAWMLERINPERFTKPRRESIAQNDLEQAVGTIACIITEEVKNSKTQHRIFARLQEMLQNTTF